MRRIIFFIVVFYIVGLAIVDTVALQGRYTQLAMNQVNYQIYRGYAEIQILLDRMGIGTIAVARP